MNTRIFEAFEAREQQVKQFMAGCGMKYGMPCTCGPECRCENCPEHSGMNLATGEQLDTEMDTSNSGAQGHFQYEGTLQVDQPMNFFGMEPPPAGPPAHLSHSAPAATMQEASNALMQEQASPGTGDPRAQRNPSVISYGNNGLRHMSLTSETTFGRAMSGLSALSIDWENLDDFDVDVDHSAHIGPAGPVGSHRRTSFRRSFVATAPTIGENVVQNGDGMPFSEAI